MEAAGLGLAVPPLTVQLVKLYAEGYEIIGNVKVAGSNILAKDKDLRVIRHRFDDWLKSLKDLPTGGDLEELYGSDRYRTVMTILVEFVQALIKAGNLLDSHRNGRNKPAGSDAKVSRPRIQYGIEASINPWVLMSPQLLSAFGKPKFQLGRIPARILDLAVPGVVDALNITEVEVRQFQRALTMIQVTKYTVIGEKQLAELVHRLERLIDQLNELTKVPLRKALGNHNTFMV